MDKDYEKMIFLHISTFFPFSHVIVAKSNSLLYFHCLLLTCKTPYINNMKTKQVLLSTVLLSTLAVTCSSMTCMADSWEPTINQTVFKGDMKRLILLVETEDRPFYTPNAQGEYDRMLNGENYTGLGCEGSAREFLIDNSGGQFRPQFIVAGPIRLSKSMGYYGGKPKEGEGNDGDNGKLVMEACRLADEQFGIDFSELDYNNDGKVDNVYIFYSGPNDTGIPTPWPHASGVAGGGLYLDGKLIDSYAISQEMATETVRGAYTTFLHEFGHTLGLCDDYSGRLGMFSIYCNGTFDGGVIPVNFNAAERLILGWLDYDVIDHDGEYTLEPLAKNKALMLKTNNPDEYFLFSNRSNSRDITPWDSHFEYGGMLVWHIDRSQNKVTLTNSDGSVSNFTALGMWHNNSPNAATDHPCHELIEADNRNDPYNYRAGMYFPGPRYQTELNSRTHSEFRTWSGAPIGAEIYDITQESDGNITFKVRNLNTAGCSITVTDPSGKLQTNAYVSMTPVEEVATQSVLIPKMLKASASRQKFTGSTGLTGTCTISGVPAGKYELLVDKEGFMIYTAIVDVSSGDNSFNVTIQAPSDFENTRLSWYEGPATAVFFVSGQVRTALWDTSDLSSHVGKQLSSVEVQLGGENHMELWVFIDDECILKKDVPDPVENGVTTIDLSAENIMIEEGRTLKVGYLLKDDKHSEWPSTCDQGRQVIGKGGLIYDSIGDVWYESNDLNANWAIWINLTSEFEDTPVEAIEFDESYVELSVGEEKTLRANILPIEVVNRKVTWTSSDEAIATIDADGTVHALSTGDVTITATSVQNPEISAQCKVHVKISSEMIGIQTFQREARLSWPGENPDYKWIVRYRETGTEEYASSVELIRTTAWLTGLKPDTEYEGYVEIANAGDEDSTSPVDFSFSTEELTSEYPVINITINRPSTDDVIPLIVSNITDNEYSIKWTVDGTETEDLDYVCSGAGNVTLTAKVTLSDGSVETLVKELTIDAE